MAPLFQRVAGWDCYHRVREAMRLRGFPLHESFTRILAEVAGTKSETLETYWREAVREYVSSAGKNNTNTRTFIPNIGYRSVYLENLAGLLPVSDTKEKYLSLLPELREIDREDYGWGPRIDLLRKQTSKSKFQEYADTVTIPVADISTKKNQFEVFAVMAHEMGFIRKRKSVSKASGKIWLKVVADLGGRSDANGIQFSFHVYHESEPKLIFYVIPDFILPGVGYYTIYPDLDGGIHGLKAMCCFCDILLQSFTCADK